MAIDMTSEEIQISVDPVSMKEVIAYPSFGRTKPRTTNKPLPSLPKKNKFLSTSLPNSACSSPRGIIPKSKGKDISQALDASLGQEHSVALSRLVWLRESRLQRSKSCGEGRPSGQYDEFDICHTSSKTSTISASADSTPRCQTTSDNEYRRIDPKKHKDEDFKCGALCLFLPGFGKGKIVRSRRGEREEMGHVISHRVSLEKFECGSWRSSGILNGGSDFSSNLYFDLPLELIQTSGNDANLPVSSAFLFDKDVKGVLKTKGGGERKSNDGRHVRFSTSSPTTSPSSCITPRMRKARDEFNSFLEAQNA
ncbi:hypothetical protein E3N88_42353 [Mikania micrantha]|uniref:Uncharacterized protein n=1 Tax=Mikania micrantha TaxID=192012 RepID=A0A5N6LI00_9ASTR|nr:hypothetical protein E3N88_42353 [Mikania micrantha]